MKIRVQAEERESGGWRNGDEEIKQQPKNECRHALWTRRFSRKWAEGVKGRGNVEQI